MHKQNVIVRWLLLLFAVSIVMINAGLSYAFGHSYLGSAFSVDGWLSAIIGGLYAVLVADVAFLVWFWSYRRIANTVAQRSLSLVIGSIALGLSIAMSINQLAVNSYGLVDLSAYHDAVGLVALTVVIITTALHIAGLAVFSLTDAEEMTKNKSIDIRARLVGESLDGVEKSMDAIRTEVVAELQNTVRRDVLMELGFGPGSAARPRRFPAAEVPQNGAEPG